VTVKKGHGGSSSKPSSSTAECIQVIKYTDTAVRAAYTPSKTLAKYTKIFCGSNIIKYCSEEIPYVTFPVKNHTVPKIRLSKFTPG
jgi:hypothetical protein